MENDPLVGKQLGAYLIQHKIGDGGMARVYKAYHARLKRDVAIKVILPEVAAEPGFRERFEREAQVIASLEHRNIVAVYDFGEVGNLTYLVMQYVGGGTLRDQLRGERPLDPRRAAQYALQMANALHHAHQRGIVHRDVKPQNMLVPVNNPNDLLLSDFGIAKLFGNRPEITYNTQPEQMQGMTGNSDASLTSIGQIVGTAEYMAPEQINMQQIDARTDVYALGVVLYQMLTGQVPFHSTTVQGLLFQHVYTPPKPLREINPYVPEVLEQITTIAMAKRPEHRYPSAGSMAQALETIITPSTYPLSAPLTGNFSSTAPTTNPSGGYIAQPSQYTSAPSVHSYYGPQGSSQPSSFSPDTTGGHGIAVPPVQKKRTGVSIGSIVIAAIVVVAVIVSLYSQGRLPFLNQGSSSSNGGGNNSTVYTTSFVDNFQDNTHGWTGNSAGLTAIVSNNTYTLSDSDGNSYFPHPTPDGSVNGPLPDKFTLSETIQQKGGATSIPYGIAFRIRQDGQNLYAYVLAITGDGSYAILKYSGTENPNQLWEGNSFAAIQQGLNKSNTLKVVVKGSSFTFYVNDTIVPINGNASQDQSGTDTDLKGGQLGVFVSGQNTSFVVTSVALNIP